MARRYIGDAVITITYHDAGDYRGTVRAGGYSWRFDALRGPAVGFGSGIAYDSAKAYDKMAASAVSFGSYYTTYNRGDDVPDWAPKPEVADAIDEATSWAQDDRGEYQVRRSPTGESHTSEAANMRRRSRKNPLPGGDVGILVGLGVLVAGVVGYAVYQATQSSQTAAAGGGSATSGAQSTNLGSGGSAAPVGPAAGSPNAFEAGPGADAPLVPTEGA